MEEIVEGQAKLQIVQVEIKTAQHHPNGRVERCPRCNLGVILFLYHPIEGRVCTANVGNLFAVELGLYTRFAKNEDSFFVRRQLEDAGDVNCSAVGRAKDFILVLITKVKEYGTLERETYNGGRDPHARELLLVIGARLCTVICNKDDLLAFAMVILRFSIVKPRSKSNLCCAAAQESRLFLGRDALRTIRRLSFYIFSSGAQHTSGLGCH